MVKRDCSIISSLLLNCMQLVKYYKYSNFSIKVLNCITIAVKYNEIIAIIGESGSGKSTLLHLMGGLDKPNSGDVFFEGSALNKLSDKDCSFIRNKRMGFIYQFHHLLSDFSVLENVAMPLLIGGMKLNIAKKRAQFLLELVGLHERNHHYPHELSGGESQRVAIIRSVINNPVLVLADEPTGNLDQKNSDKFFNLLEKLNLNYKTTFIIATHDLNLARRCHKIYIIANGVLKQYTK